MDVDKTVDDKLMHGVEPFPMMRAAFRRCRSVRCAYEPVHR
jgi:hypothetical protein